MTELKPCPHCGTDGHPELHGSIARGGRFVKCEICGFSAPIAAWNTRAVPRTDGDDGELVERLAPDAARYRWLRDESCPPHNFYISVPDEFAGVKYGPNEVDDYIDKARQALGAKT